MGVLNPHKTHMNTLAGSNEHGDWSSYFWSQDDYLMRSRIGGCRISFKCVNFRLGCVLI